MSVTYEPEPVTWAENGLVFTEVMRHEYTNCDISAGTIENHYIDTVYLRFRRHSEPGDPSDDMIYLRPDEVAAVIWCMSGVLQHIFVQGTKELQKLIEEGVEA